MAVITFCLLLSIVGSTPLYQLTPGAYEGEVQVIIQPSFTAKERNSFVYGDHLTLGLSLALQHALPEGATIEVWLSELAPHSDATRVGVNSFFSKVDVCKQLATLDPALNLPSSCPIPAFERFSFNHTVTENSWKNADAFKQQMIGSTGVLQLRLWSRRPCVLCFGGKKPVELAGLSVPFEIVEEVRPTRDDTPISVGSQESQGITEEISLDFKTDL